MPNDKFFEDDLAILAEFVDESAADLAKVSQLLLELEKQPANQELTNAIFRPIHSLKGNSAFLGLMQLRVLAHAMESLLDDFRKQRSTPQQKHISVLLQGCDTMQTMLAQIRRQAPEVSDAAAFQRLLQELRALQASGTPAAAADPSPVPPPATALPDQQTAASKPAADATRSSDVPGATVRIPEKALDDLEQLQQALVALRAQILAGNDSADTLKKAAEKLDEIAAAMHAQLTALRYVSAGDLLNRAPRIARETAAVTGKNVKVLLAGADLRIPKHLLQTLESPLMHLVRNAVDHGIEQPETRRRIGKNAEGQIWVEARVDDKNFLLRVADDGAGIDFKALLAKAMAQGLCPRNRNLTPQDVVNLIFLPGISTAREVSEISGRGVGMDVVKKNIEAAGGRIQVNSKTGKGTEILLSLPYK